MIPTKEIIYFQSRRLKDRRWWVDVLREGTAGRLACACLKTRALALKKALKECGLDRRKTKLVYLHSGGFDWLTGRLMGNRS